MLGGLVRLLIIVVAVLLIVRSAVYVYDIGYRLFTEAPVSNGVGKDITFVVEDGMSAWEIATALEEAGAVNDSIVFFLQNFLSDYSDSMTAGTYTVNTSMVNEEIMAVLSGVEYSEE